MRIARRLRPYATCVALACAAALAHADPAAEEPHDGLAQFLRDKSIVAVDAATAATAPVRRGGEAAGVFLRDLGQRTHDVANDLVVRSLGFVGLRYQRGGNSAETGFDCSGFVRYLYQSSLGLALPRRADEQAKDRSLVVVDRADLKPGDLVFFNTMKRTFSHVGIYIGDNRFVHSPRTGEEVRTDDMTFSYWARRFTGARRVADPALAALAATAASAPLPPATPQPN